MHPFIAQAIWACVPISVCLILAQGLRGAQSRLSGRWGTHHRRLAATAAVVEGVAALGAAALLATWLGVVLIQIVTGNSAALPGAVELAILLGGIATAALTLEAWTANVGDRFWSPALALGAIAAALGAYWAPPLTHALFWAAAALVAALLVAAAAKDLLPWWTGRLLSVENGRRAAVVLVLVMVVLATAFCVVAGTIVYLTETAVLWAETVAAMLAGYALAEERAPGVVPAGNLARLVAFFVPFVVAGTSLIPGVLTIVACVLLGVLVICLVMTALLHHEPHTYQSSSENGTE